MTNSERLDNVRKCLYQWIITQDAPEVDGSSPEIQSESMLIRDEFFCGRCFRTEAYRAVWFLEEDELKIYSNQDGLRDVLDSERIQTLASQSEERSTESDCDEIEDDSSERNILKMPSAAKAEESDIELDQDRRRAA